MSSTQDIRKIIKLIPGYDPYRDAEGCWFDADEAQLACDFFPEFLVFFKGPLQGRPFQLEPWEMALVANAFGWKTLRECKLCKGTGNDNAGEPCAGCHGTGQWEVRRYRDVFLFVPRKNGKTTLVAGIANLVLFADGEYGAEIYSAAADREQASLAFDTAQFQVNHDPDLARRSKSHYKRITVESTHSFYQAISSDAHTKFGFDVHCAMIDEVHAHPNSKLIDALVTGTAARKQPLVFYITTSDIERQSICNDLYDRAVRVRDGITPDPAFLPIIYEAGKEDDWTDPKVWAKANPNLGISVDRDYFERECK